MVWRACSSCAGQTVLCCGCSRALLRAVRALPNIPLDTTMSLATSLASTSRPRTTFLTHTRSVSSSPYGRTHVWKHRQRTLPKPFVPQFPQRVVRVDGSTFTHYTTSPRSLFRLTRDSTNNPLWNAARLSGETEEEDLVTGRLGRFNRRFDGLGGHGQVVDWTNEASGETLREELALESEDGEKST
ncbi:hypothetical protein B0H21DRAFT_252515 [Amylocystis lapponica]|nr:hypothetical protein B0H21DRAFT_252515 [Amylocystis lapponica]